MYQVHVVENGVQATNTIDSLKNEGFGKEHIYIFAHDKNRSEHLTEATSTGGVGISEQGLFESVGNLFRSRGDELRAKFRAVGLTEMEAEQYEKDLDEGRLVVVASDQATN